MRELADAPLLEAEEIEALRTRVAEFLGWTNLRYSSRGPLVGMPPGIKKFTAVPPYGTDIKAAWEIVVFLAKQGIRVNIENQAASGLMRPFVVEIGERAALICRVRYASLAVAICLAFELAMKPKHHP